MTERIGQGTLLAFSADAGSTWTTIARVETIGEFHMGDVEDVEITTHDTAGGMRQYIAGLGDAGELTFSGVWTADTTQRMVMGLRGLLRDWRITLPGGLGTFRCQGYLKRPTINPQREGRIEFSGAIKLTGAPTLT